MYLHLLTTSGPKFVQNWVVCNEVQSTNMHNCIGHSLVFDKDGKSVTKDINLYMYIIYIQVNEKMLSTL